MRLKLTASYEGQEKEEMKNVRNPKITSVSWCENKTNKEIQKIKYGKEVRFLVETEDASDCWLMFVVQCKNWKEPHQRKVIKIKLSHSVDLKERTYISFKPESSWLKNQKNDKGELSANIQLFNIFPQNDLSFLNNPANKRNSDDFAWSLNEAEGRYQGAMFKSMQLCVYGSRDVQKIGISKMVIVLDPGHGVKGKRKGKNMEYIDHGSLKLKDPNGLEYGENVKYQESDIALDISKKLQNSLNNIIPYSDIYLTRTKEIDLLNQTELDTHYLNFRWKFANSKNADVLISIHCNSGSSSSTGFEICFDKASAYNISLSKSIIESQNVINIRNTSHYNKTLTALSGFNGDAAILIEVGFIVNDNDVQLMINKPTEIAMQIANGIKNWIENH